jgi:transposase InsO family protein
VARREAAGLIQLELGLSERRSCRVLGVSRSLLQYVPRPDRNVELRARLKALAEARRRFGSPRLHVLLKREGWRVNHKRVERLAMTRGLPEVITVDNGPEFAGKALDAWAYQKCVKLHFIRPGKPVENAYIESFNGKFRDECLNENIFRTIEEVRIIIETWRIDYNRNRPHSSLGNLTPEEYAEQERVRQPETRNPNLQVA